MGKRKKSKEQPIESQDILNDVMKISELSRDEKKQHRKKSHFLNQFNSYYGTLNDINMVKQQLKEIRQYFLSHPKGSINDIYNHVMSMYDNAPADSKPLIQEFIDEMDAKWVRSKHESKRKKMSS